VFYISNIYFGCGVVKVDNKNGRLKYQLSSYVDFSRVLIPLLDKTPLWTSKLFKWFNFSKSGWNASE